MGVLKLKTSQAEKLGLKPRSQLSPMLEKCCLRLCANESYQNAEDEIKALTGIKVGHSTHQRLVNRQQLPLPQVKQRISEVSVDREKCGCEEYRSSQLLARLQSDARNIGIYYGAFFEGNQSLIDYVNSQPLVKPLVCLEDGHQGVMEFNSGVRHTPGAVRNFRLVSSQRESILGGWVIEKTQAG